MRSGTYAAACLLFLGGLVGWCCACAIYAPAAQVLVVAAGAGVWLLAFAITTVLYVRTS